MSDDRLIIFDTTLRDGEQSPGASMNLAEKLEVAHALKDLGVDVIEAGFPIASPGDFEAVQAIARAGAKARSSAAWPAATPPTSTAPARRCADAAQPRIHVFLATSAIHREFKLQDGQGRDRPPGRRGRPARQGLLRRRRVLAGRRRPHRAGFPRRGRRDAPSRPAPPRSTSPTRSATPCRASTPPPSRI